MAYNVSRNVSSSRKMLKFLQFMESLKKSYLFQVDQKQKSLSYRIIEQTRIISSFFLYLADNIVWLSNIGLISANVVEGYGYRLPWLVIKDIFAFVKNVSGLVKAIITLRRRSRKIKSLADQINKLHETEKVEESSHSLIRTLINKRSKQRFERVGILRYILRILMLLSRLTPFRKIRID